MRTMDQKGLAERGNPPAKADTVIQPLPVFCGIRSHDKTVLSPPGPHSRRTSIGLIAPKRKVNTYIPQVGEGMNFKRSFFLSYSAG